MCRPAASIAWTAAFTPWLARWRTRSGATSAVALAFSFSTVTIRTSVAWARIGMASATARAAGRLPSQAMATRPIEAGSVPAAGTSTTGRPS